MNKYNELTLLTLKKWDLVRYIYELYDIIDTALDYNQDMREHLNKELWFGRLEAQGEILRGERNSVNNYFDKERRNNRNGKN
jgi:hypothetical protein